MIFAALAFSLFSCSEKGDEENGEKTPITASVTYIVSDVLDLRDIANVTVSYKDADGTMKSIALTQQSWNFNIENIDSLPFEAELILDAKLKTDIKYSKEKYNIGRTIKIDYKLSDGTIVISGNSADNSIGLKPENFEHAFKRFPKTDKVTVQERN